MKIIFSNLGYAKGISGSLLHHLRYLGRHLYTSPFAQNAVLKQFRKIIEDEVPDVCCLVEVDQGSFHSAYYNQIRALMDDVYHFHDVAHKYGERSWLNHAPLHRGKSNALLARAIYPFKRLYFSYGSKRLIYRVDLPQNTTLFFAHFSLQRKVRALQMVEMRALALACNGPVIILADFNIMQGFQELRPLIEGTDLTVLNDENVPTFTFHRRTMALDLCICSQQLAAQAQLKVVPQPFSDHAALLVEVPIPTV